MRQKDIRNFQSSYHRNGVSGEGFHLCRFRFRVEGTRHAVDMQAVVFEARGHVAVISADMAERWRGDDFEPLLRAAIALEELSA